MYWVPKCGFYLGIIDVVEVAERIRVDNLKTWDLQKKCHKLSQMSIQTIVRNLFYRLYKYYLLLL